MGGAMKHLADDEAAISRRDADWCYHALSLWMDPSKEAADAHVKWARDLSEDMKPEVTEGVYLNFTSDNDDDRVRRTYGADKYARLVALKDQYDPGNLFHMNSNIKPSIEATARADRGG